MPEKQKEQESYVGALSINHKTGNLHAKWFDLQKISSNGEFTFLGAYQGENEYPFKANGIVQSLVANEHHSTCLLAKTSATVGLGFLSDFERENGPQALNSPSVNGEMNLEALGALKGINPFYLPSNAEDSLDELCEYSWQDVIEGVCNDFYRAGNGFMEVARDTSGTVTGLWHLPFYEMRAYVEDLAGRNWHWRLKNQYGTKTSLNEDVIMARWGDKERLLESVEDGSIQSTGINVEGVDTENLHEVIHFRNSMGLHKIYGFPEWLGASQAIELVSALMQYKYDFFLNRGVPEFAVFVTGARVGADDWKKIEDAIRDNVGPTNSHKSFALNLGQKDVEIQVEKLGLDGKADTGVFKDKESLQSDIVTAHRVPPLLGNILIPGKLGASNEFPNALMAFQALTINGNQKTFQNTLAKTLGSSEAGLGLTKEDLIFRKITDLIDLGKADTISRMRENVTEAQAEGRDIEDGLKD